MSASILIIDDEIKMGKALRHVLLKEGYRVDITGDAVEGLAMLKADSYEILLCDLKMPAMSGLDVLERIKEDQPDINVIMMTAYASAETAVESMKKGAYDYLIKPFSTDELKILINRCLKTRSLQEENELLKEQLRDRYQPDNIVIVSKSMRALLDRSRKVASSKATVLISGESGTGKEMIAMAIHEAGSRRDLPLVVINCGALTETLLESELFGHRKGAFTGAIENRAGLFETAHGGTLFLDEIGEISPAMQVKLLRVLQLGEFQRVGESRTVSVDVRVIAATNCDLEKMVAEGSFRADLYYRLNVVPFHIPPLRERREDIAALIEHFLKHFDPKAEHWFSAEALRTMMAFDWPGNVRELINAIEHAVVLAEGDEMGLDLLPVGLRAFAGETKENFESPDIEAMTLERVEKFVIGSAMRRTSNNMTQAAKHLGVTRRILGYRLRKHGMYHKDLDGKEVATETEE